MRFGGLVALSDFDGYGLYHATAEGQCSWHEFACAIFAAAGLAVQVDVADPAEFPAKVPRPLYSVLENRRLKAAGKNIFRSWKDGLAEYLGAPAGALAGTR